jgi:hypothetical protein
MIRQPLLWIILTYVPIVSKLIGFINTLINAMLPRFLKLQFNRVLCR